MNDASNEFSIKPWTNTSVITVTPDTSIEKTASLMYENRIGAILVVDDEKVAGIFTERDLLQVAAQKIPLKDPVSCCLTEKLITLSSGAHPGEAVSLMLKKNIRHIPVVDEGRLTGMISVRDLLRHRYQELEDKVISTERELDDARALIKSDHDDRLKTLLEDNERLKKMAVTDELTSLYNHRYFQERLLEEIERAKRYSYPVSLLFLDVDNFKHYNDTNGHPEGDYVLKTIGRLLSNFTMEIHITAKLRKSDVVARYGGEEFVVLLPYTDGAKGSYVAERLCSTIEAYPFRNEEKQPGGQLTVSIGVAAFPDRASSADELVRFADQALYDAKKQGKNRVVLYNNGPESD